MMSFPKAAPYYRILSTPGSDNNKEAMGDRPKETDALQTVRRILLIIVVSSMIGIETELFLLEHVKPILQLLPVLLIGIGLGTLLWSAVSKSSEGLRGFQVTMAVCIAVGMLGIFVHLASSASDAVKKDKTLIGMKLIE